jgi:hypothetical protein
MLTIQTKIGMSKRKFTLCENAELIEVEPEFISDSLMDDMEEPEFQELWIDCLEDRV